MKEKLEKVDKLIELLNKYEDEERETEDGEVLSSEIWKIKDKTIIYNGIKSVQISNTFLVPIIISKQYGFIKWLIDNKLIDIHADYDGLIRCLAVDSSPLKALLTILK